jgi:hypothetical protein
MNSFSKIISILIAVVLMFVAPLLYLSQKQDAINQTVIEKETTEFINTIRNNGYVTREMYRRYIEKIDKTGNLYNIEICHAHKKTVPNYDESTNTVLDGYYSYNLNTYQDEIFESFDKDEDYLFNQGDFISVTVTNRNKTMATRIMEAIYSRALQTEQIIFTYGGMIRDEVD